MRITTEKWTGVIGADYKWDAHDIWTYMGHKKGVDLYDYAAMEITWDNGNTTTTRWGAPTQWCAYDEQLYLAMCQGKTQRQIDQDIYHGRVKGYNHWQRTEATTIGRLAVGDVVDVTKPGCVSGTDESPASRSVQVALPVGLRGTIMANPHLDSADGCCHDFKDR